MFSCLIRCVPVVLLAVICVPTQAAEHRDYDAESLPSTSASSRYKDNLDEGTVTDLATGLVWRRCAEGQTDQGATGGGCDGTSNHYTWQAALGLVRDPVDGESGWRLPNKNELDSLLDVTRSSSPQINVEFFPNTPSDKFWTASPCVEHSDRAWRVSFENGGVSCESMSREGPVRLLKDQRSF